MSCTLSPYVKLSRVDGPDSPLRDKISSDKRLVLRALKLKELMKLERKKERMVKSILNLLKFEQEKYHFFLSFSQQRYLLKSQQISIKKQVQVEI